MTQIKPLWTCISDFFIIICLLVVTAVLEAPNREPYHQCVPGWTKDTNNGTTKYPCDSQEDPALHYPYKPNTISTTVLPMLTFGPWLIIVIGSAIYLKCKRKDSSFDWKSIGLILRMLLFSACGTEVCTNAHRYPFYPCTHFPSHVHTLNG
jgi:hypothetical protein